MNKTFLKEIDRAIRLTKRYPTFKMEHWHLLFHNCAARSRRHKGRTQKKWLTRSSRFYLAHLYKAGGVNRQGYVWGTER